MLRFLLILCLVLSARGEGFYDLYFNNDSIRVRIQEGGSVLCGQLATWLFYADNPDAPFSLFIYTRERVEDAPRTGELTIQQARDLQPIIERANVKQTDGRSRYWYSGRANPTQIVEYALVPNEPIDGFVGEWAGIKHRLGENAEPNCVLPPEAPRLAANTPSQAASSETINLDVTSTASTSSTPESSTTSLQTSSAASSSSSTNATSSMSSTSATSSMSSIMTSSQLSVSSSLNASAPSTILTGEEVSETEKTEEKEESANINTLAISLATIGATLLIVSLIVLLIIRRRKQHQARSAATASWFDKSLYQASSHASPSSNGHSTAYTVHSSDLAGIRSTAPSETTYFGAAKSTWSEPAAASTVGRSTRPASSESLVDSQINHNGRKMSQTDERSSWQGGRGYATSIDDASALFEKAFDVDSNRR